MAVSRTLRAACAAFLLALLTTSLGGGGRPAAQGAESPCEIRTNERVVAVADVHGAYDTFLQLLRTAGLVDTRGRWSGGRAVLIQTGDVLDRGPDSKKVLDLLQRLERDALRAGGRVYALLGNHEFMRVVGDWRYVSVEETAAFKDSSSSDRRQQVYEMVATQAEDRASAEKRPFDAKVYREEFMRDIPLGFLEMRLAFDRTGDYGKWVRSRLTAVKVNGVLFMHGGISPENAQLGCDGINKAVSRDLTSLPVPPDQIPALFSSTETGPLWYRGLATEPEDTFAPSLEEILTKVGARAIVIGHTPVLSGRIVTRFGGRVIQLDTGMLNGKFFPNGVASALEIKGDSFTAIYQPDRREPLSVPALAAATR